MLSDSAFSSLPPFLGAEWVHRALPSGLDNPFYLAAVCAELHAHPESYCEYGRRVRFTQLYHHALGTIDQFDPVRQVASISEWEHGTTGLHADWLTAQRQYDTATAADLDLRHFSGQVVCFLIGLAGLRLQPLRSDAIFDALACGLQRLTIDPVLLEEDDTGGLKKVLCQRRDQEHQGIYNEGWEAAKKGSVRAVTFLLDHDMAGAKLDRLLVSAAMADSVPLMRILIDQYGADPCSSGYLFPPLHAAAAEGSLRAAKYLIQHCHVPVDFVTSHKTPLFYAAREGQDVMCRFLVSLGADKYYDGGEGPIKKRVPRSHKELKRFLK